MKEIKNRRSIRRYKSLGVEESKIQKILESAMLAPSGSNTQPWNFIIVKAEDTKQKLAKVNNNQDWMMSAPVMIVCVADIESRIEDTTGIYLDEL
ncbi:nitroreductase family protein [Paraclostridium bifermentans]